MTSEKSAGPAAQHGTDPLALARAGIGQARRKATDVIDAAREKGEAVIDAAREKSEAVIEDTREKTYRAAAETSRLFQEHPIAAVAAAAAAGAVLAIFLPRVALAGQATKLAGRAVKAAAASEAAQAVYSGIKETRDAALRSTAGKAATAVGERIRSRKDKASDAESEDA